MSIIADGQEFKVRISDEPIGDDLESRVILGMTTGDTNVIVVDGTLPRTRREEVMLHELLHLADSTLPEFMISNLGTKLYGILGPNNILKANWMTLISDGLPTSAEMARVQARNDEIKELEEQGLLVMRTTEGIKGDQVPVTKTRHSMVSEGPWFGDPVNDGLGVELNVREDDGTLNRVAVHRAATYLIGGGGSSRKDQAREVLRLFRQELEESPPPALETLVRGL